MPLLLAAALLVAPRVGAQQAAIIRTPPPTIVHSLTNVGLGAVTATVHALLRDVPRNSLGKAALEGALGGAVMDGGFRLIGTRRPEYGFAGLQTVALGANVVRNAGAGRGMLSDLVFPVLPLYVRVRPGHEHPLTVRLSAVATVSAVALALEDGNRIDWATSARHGSLTFENENRLLRTRGGPGSGVVAHHRFGSLQYGQTLGVEMHRENVLAHETIHAGEFIRDAVTNGVAAHDALFEGRRGWWTLPARLLVFDVVLPLYGANEVTRRLVRNPEFGRWYEREARGYVRARLCLPEYAYLCQDP